MRLVLDTSTVTSGTRKAAGASAALMELGFCGEFDWLMSVPLLFEYQEVLSRPEQRAYSGLTIDQIDDVLALILRVAVLIELGPYKEPSSPDPDDNHVLSLAKYGHADAIVTFNTRHFSAAARELGVNLGTAAWALQALRR